MTALLHIDDLSIQFGGIRALDGITFDVNAGEVCGLIGPNGAGKTTLFNCVTRIYQPTSGYAAMNDFTTDEDGNITTDEDGNEIIVQRPLLRVPPYKVIQLGIARTFQNLALFPTMTVLQNVVVGMQSRHTAHVIPSLLGWPTTRKKQRELTDEALQILGQLDLAEFADHPASGLPFGTLKRVELARAVAAHPKLLMLDEPAGGLTHEEVDELGTTIQRLRDEFELTILLVEHHMGLVMGISDHVVAMDFGRKIADGTPQEVRDDPAVIAAYLGADEDAEAAVEHAADELEVQSEHQPETQPAGDES